MVTQSESSSKVDEFNKKKTYNKLYQSKQIY